MTAPFQQHVLNWLYSVLTSEYCDVNRTYDDVAQCLSQFPSLLPRTDVHTFASGSSALLIHLSGTLPVTIRHSTYRFPLSIWIPHVYPRDAPLVYVTPTETMTLRPGQHVDSQGRIYHPYLSGFSAHPKESSILGLLAILTDIFAREPPVVVARPSSNALGADSPTSKILDLKISGTYSQRRSESRFDNDSSWQNRTTPPRPPPKSKPVELIQEYGRTDTSGRAPSELSNSTRTSSRYDHAPPLPHRQRWGSVSEYQSQPFSVIPHQPYQAKSLAQSPVPHVSLPVPAPPNPLPLPENLAATQSQKYPHGWHDHSGPAWHLDQSGSNPTPQSPQYVHPSCAPSYVEQLSQGQHRSDARQADLLDEPFSLNIPQEAAAPPPIPPNPEKDTVLHQVAKTLCSMRQRSRQQDDSSLAGLGAQRVAMHNVLPAIQSEIGQLQQLSVTLSLNQSILREALSRADHSIDGSVAHQAPDVDELLVGPTIVANQLYSLIAEERALGDAIFMLGRAVERGRMSSTTFAKMTRSLAREWYLKKALVDRIGKGMGLIAP